jgi:hypothetical protein
MCLSDEVQTVILRSDDRLTGDGSSFTVSLEQLALVGKSVIQLKNFFISDLTARAVEITVTFNNSRTILYDSKTKGSSNTIALISNTLAYSDFPHIYCDAPQGLQLATITFLDLTTGAPLLVSGAALTKSAIVLELTRLKEDTAPKRKK